MIIITSKIGQVFLFSAKVDYLFSSIQFFSQKRCEQYTYERVPSLVFSECKERNKKM